MKLIQFLPKKLNYNFYRNLTPSRITFYYRQIRLLLKYRTRLTFESLSVIIEKSANIFIAPSARLNIGSRVCLRKGVEIEAYDEAIINIGSNFF